MAELEIDQSNLPRVQEVCQCFAVLEDGVLAHSLQEQEIEQYYSTNVQKNQLVQNDIRVAKRLQDEEESQWAQQSVVRQSSRQLEEQDFELARVIQDEMQRNAEEARKRELDDEEVAKRLQEEEEQRIRVRRRGENGHSEGEEQYPTNSARGQYSTSDNQSESNGTLAVSPRELLAHRNGASRSNQGHGYSFHHRRHEFRESLSEDSDSDTVFKEQLSLWSQRWNRRVNTAPHHQRASARRSQEMTSRSQLSPRRSFTDEVVVYEGERGGLEEEEDDYDRDERKMMRNQNCGRSQREVYEEDNRLRRGDRDSRSARGRERHLSRTESVRIHDRSAHRNRDLVRTWSYKDQPDKHVHFQDNARASSRRSDESRQVWEMLGQVLMERGVPVKLGGDGAPLQIRPQRRDSQVLHGSEVSCCSSQPHQRDFQRAAPTRHSFHGDIRKRRKSSHREDSGRDHRDGRDRHCDEGERDGEVHQISSRHSFHVSRERQGSRRWREHGYANGGEGEQNVNHHRVKRTTSQRGQWQRTAEERFVSIEEEKEEVERRIQWPPRRASTRARPSHVSAGNATDSSQSPTAGLSLEQDPAEAGLHLGELQQVLEDEELARKLQEEEEKLVKKNPCPSPRSSYPEGDFRAAQVAQDEEIARFMQKQEMKLKHRSCELEGPSSWREHRAMITYHDRRAARERKVQRERLDSEGLPSPTEDCSPENQPPSPISTSPQTQNIRNIAEELDPTFQGRRQETNQLPPEPTGPSSQSVSVAHSGLNDVPGEPAFIPPTKRQMEKPARTKPKEKKENCKQQ